MSEHFPETEPREARLNRIVIIDALQEIGIDVQLSDWLEYDDNQILGDLATYAAMQDIGMEDLFEMCQIDIESIGGEYEV